MGWARRRYRDHKVWVLVDEAGHPVEDDRGLASVRYQPNDARTYTVRPADIGPLKGEAPPEERPIQVFFHGQAGEEDGPAGLGVVLAWRDRLRELRRSLRAASAWEAELAALLLALRTIRRPDLPVIVHGAHAAALRDLLTGRGPHAASSLGRALRESAARFASLTIEEASGRPEHSRAVALAEEAAQGES